MSQKFSFSGKAAVLHLNARKEGPDDDKQLALDIKFRASAPAKILSLFDANLEGFLFTDIGAVRNAMIGPIPFEMEVEDYRLDAMGSTHFGVKLKKFVVEPVDGSLCAITFQASFKPSGDEVAQMAEYLQDEISINIVPSNNEFDFGDGQGATA